MSGRTVRWNINDFELEIYLVTCFFFIILLWQLLYVKVQSSNPESPCVKWNQALPNSWLWDFASLSLSVEREQDSTLLQKVLPMSQEEGSHGEGGPWERMATSILQISIQMDTWLEAARNVSKWTLKNWLKKYIAHCSTWQMIRIWIFQSVISKHFFQRHPL